jgi:prepilin-type processing-associated H-X9-DG protein
VGDVVSDQTVFYYCAAANTGYEPPEGHWQILEGIVGRHEGYANVLFADWHVEAVQVAATQTAPNLNINYDYSKWTLPGK